MRSTALAHLMLCCAAVLFLPQALECCSHTGTHTVLEALAGAAEGAPVRPMHARTDAYQTHAAAEQRERVIEQLTAIATGQKRNDSAQLQLIANVSLPGGQYTGQSPSLAAFILKGVESLDTGFRLIARSLSDETVRGREDRPTTPPPRLLL